jgi:hypothetical protein
MPDENFDATPPVTGKTTATGNNKMLYILGGSVFGLAAIGGLVFFLMQQNSTPPPADDSNQAAATTGAATGDAGNGTGLVEDGPGTKQVTAPVAPGVPKPTTALAGKPGTGAVAFALPTKDSWTILAEKMKMKDKIVSSAPAPTGGESPMGGLNPTAAGGGATGGAGGKPIKDISKMIKTAGGRRPDPFVSFYKLVTPRTPATQFAISDRLASPVKPPPPPVDDRKIEDIYGPLPIVERRVAGILYNGGISAILEIGTFPSSETYVVRPGDKVTSGIPSIGDMTVESINLTELMLRAPDGRTAKVKISGLRPEQISAILSQMGNGAAGAGTGGAPAGPAGPGMGGGGFAGGKAGGAGGAPSE